MRMTAKELRAWLEVATIRGDVVFDIGIVPQQPEDSSVASPKRGRPGKVKSAWTPARRAAHGEKIRKARSLSKADNPKRREEELEELRRLNDSLDRKGPE